MPNLFFTDAELAERDRLRRAGMENVEYSAPWLKKQGRPVFLFGAGRNTGLLLNGLFHDVPVAGIIDNNKALWGQKRYGIEVFSPEAASKPGRDPLVVVSQNLEPALSEVLRQCAEMGFRHVDWLDCQLRSDPERYGEDIETRSEVAAGFALLGDEESRRVYRASVRFRAAFRVDYLPAVSAGSQYFQDFMPSRSWRSFVDAGAFDGDTLREFLRITRGDFDSYFAFEPDPDRAKALAETYKSDRRIQTTAAALSDHIGVAGFKTSWDGSSALAEDGDIEVRLTTLDSMLKEKGATCIKMDIEGEEPAALRGSEEVIRSERPALAVCVYHQPWHLWSIPLWIASLNLRYSFRLRHHSPRIHETVCYAIPNEWM